MLQLLQKDYKIVTTCYKFYNLLKISKIQNNMHFFQKNITKNLHIS